MSGCMLPRHLVHHTLAWPLVLCSGEDFDNTILSHLASEFKKETGIDLSKDRMAVQRLREVGSRVGWRVQ